MYELERQMINMLRLFPLLWKMTKLFLIMGTISNSEEVYITHQKYFRMIRRGMTTKYVNVIFKTLGD